jgi:hypothetical protein
MQALVHLRSLKRNFKFTPVAVIRHATTEGYRAHHSMQYFGTFLTTFRKLRQREVRRKALPRTRVNRARRRAEALPLALSQITCLLCLDEFDALSLLRHAGEDGVYLHSQEHHKTRHVEPEHENYHRPQLAVDLPVVT